MDPEWWFPVEPKGPALAQFICSTCPVRTQCAAEALVAGIPDGVWGGLTADDRPRMRRRRRKELNKQ